MNILSALLGEHGPLRRELDELRRAAPGFSDDQLRAAATVFAAALESHAELEDELLFGPLAASGRMPAGPVEAMRAEHEEIVALLGHLLAPADTPGRSDPQRTVSKLAATVRDHFGHEEHVLFRLAAQSLDVARLDELGASWAVRRGVAI